MEKIIAILAVLVGFCCSCNSDKDFKEINKPTFELTSFDKEFKDGQFYCKATIQIKGLTEKYSIDGILYANDVQRIWINFPYNEDVSYDIHLEGEGKYYFNYFGSHKGDLAIELEWTSTDDRANYLVGWHLNYGFGEDCEVLLVDLNTSIIK